MTAAQEVLDATHVYGWTDLDDLARSHPLHDVAASRMADEIDLCDRGDLALFSDGSFLFVPTGVAMTQAHQTCPEFLRRIEQRGDRSRNLSYSFPRKEWLVIVRGPVRSARAGEVTAIVRVETLSGELLSRWPHHERLMSPPTILSTWPL